jgi:hypothetical protein
MVFERAGNVYSALPAEMMPRVASTSENDSDCNPGRAGSAHHSTQRDDPRRTCVAALDVQRQRDQHELVCSDSIASQVLEAANALP